MTNQKINSRLKYFNYFQNIRPNKAHSNQVHKLMTFLLSILIIPLILFLNSCASNPKTSPKKSPSAKAQNTQSTHSQNPNSPVVLITNSSSNLGKAITLKLIQNDIIVYGTDSNLDSIQHLNHLGASSLDLNLKSDSSIQVGLNKIIQTHQRLDVVINIQNTLMFSSIENADQEDLKRLFDNNIYDYTRLIQAVVPLMKQQGFGKVIQTSSILSELTFPLLGFQSASMRAIEAITDALRLELNNTNIKVIKIRPNIFKSKYYQNLAQKDSTLWEEDYLELYPQVINYLKVKISESNSIEELAQLYLEAINARYPKPSYETSTEFKVNFAQMFYSEEKMDQMIFKLLQVKPKPKYDKPKYLKQRRW